MSLKWRQKLGSIETLPKRTAWSLSMRYPRLCVIPVLITALTLQGCIAAAVPLMSAGIAAFSVFSVFKTVQLTTGGSVKFSFNEKTQQVDHSELQKVSVLGIWPGEESGVAIASTLEGSGKLKSVITPSKVTQALTDSRRTSNIAGLTAAEQLTVFQATCGAIGADALIVTRNVGTESNKNYFSFSRANQTHKSEVIIYSKAANKIILSIEMEVVLENGSGYASSPEVQKVVGQTIAEKVIAIRAS